MDFEHISQEELDEILALCLADIRSTCGVLFPDIFYAEFSKLHQEIFDGINAVFSALRRGKRKIAIAAPRGIGKTSIARAVVMRTILFRLQKFIVYISNSATSAEMQTENIKRDLTTNKQVKAIFGSIKEVIDKDNTIDESFSKSAWTAYGEMYILPRGSGQQVRGLNWNNHRPELVVIDDLEDKDEIRNEDNRKKLKEWFWSDLMKTEDRYGQGCIFIYIDTIKHEDSLLVDLLDSDDWVHVQLSICDDNYKSFDPNYMSDEEIAAEVAEHRRLGTLDTFYMERMNVPIAKEDAVFKQEYFKYFEDCGDHLFVLDKDGKRTGDPIRAYNLLHVTIVDPAKTVKIQSADSAILTVAVDRTSRKIFVRDITSGKFYPDELYTEIIRQVRMFSSFILGYEVTGLNQFIIQPLENELRVKNIHPLLMELPARGKKEERVASMAPNYKLGYMYHNPSNCGKLEGQLLGFPRSKLWDVMDGLGYINFIMDQHSVYFDPGEDTDDDYSKLQEDDYLTLKDEKPMNEMEMGFIV